MAQGRFRWPFSPRLEKRLVPPLKSNLVRSQVFPMGDIDYVPVHLLQAKPKHRTIDLFEDISPDFDNVVRPNAEDVLIKRRMVQLAQGNPICNDWLSIRIGIWGDMSCLKQGHMTKPAQCALLLVCSQDPFPEQALMKPNLHR
jgi:hypothetical protein